MKETTGVIGFVGGENPAALRQSEVDEIRARIEAVEALPEFEGFFGVFARSGQGRS